MRKNTGGPAFPRPRSSDPQEFHLPQIYEAQEGMSLRAYIATEVFARWASQDGRAFDLVTDAAYAVSAADALIAALEAS